MATILILFWRRRLQMKGSANSKEMGVSGSEHPYYLNVIASPETAETTPAASDIASTGNSNIESAYSGLKRTPDDRKSPVYAPLSLESQTQVAAYEEVKFEGYECKPDAIKLDSLLHRGIFYEVYIGIVNQLESYTSGHRVVVKKNTAGATVLEQAMLLNEIKAMQTVGRHPNIVHLIAHCTIQDPVMSVVALEENGDLRRYLKESQAHLYANTNSQQTLLKLSLDVAAGMTYLSGLKPDILHRCLNAEHVLVNENKVCKVTGFGFADHILDREKYERNKKVEAAIRWMAPEQIRHHDHSKKSDVWVFGVLMWEIHSYGEMPYAEMSMDEVKQLVLSGGALGSPPNTGDMIFDVMVKCWNMDEHERPTFSSLLYLLKQTTK